MKWKQVRTGREMMRRRAAAGSCAIAALALVLAIVGCIAASAGYADSPKTEAPPLKGSGRLAVPLGKGDLYALVVGLSKYRDASVPKLDLSEKDAKAFGDFLQTQNKVFKETKVTYLLNEKATKSEVEKYLYYTLPKAGKDDTIILFFSGHGAYDPVRPDDFLFLTYDSEPAYLGTTAVKLSGMAFLKGVGAERVLIVADACRNPGGLSEIKPKALIPSLELFLQEARSSSGKVVITSTKDGQLSWEIPNLKNSVFTHNLLEGLRGKADKDHDGVVTLNEAYEYAYAMTKEATKGFQHPQFEGRVVGQFPISYVGQAISASEARKGLYEAVKSGSSERIEQLLNAGTDVDVRDSANDTPLIASGRFGHEEVIKLLLGKGADPAAVNHELMSPLVEAAKNGHAAAVGLLLRAGVDIDGKNQDGLTALGLAAREGHLDVVQLLLDEGADIKARSATGQTALMLAASNGHINVVKILTERDADLNAWDLDGKTALVHAAHNGHADMVRFLQSRGASIEMRQGRYVDLELVRATLVSDVNRAKELLAVGASPNAETRSGDTALTLACALGNTKGARALMAGGADVNLVPDKGKTALMIAAAAGRADVVQLLVAGGAQVDLQDKEGNSALVLAARAGRTEALQELLNKLPSYAAAADQKNLALIHAAEQGATDAVRMLLAAGADANHRDKMGDTPLIRAARKGQKDVVKLLVTKDADINARNQQKCTALMAASQQGRISVVKQLLGAGADASAEDWEGKTAVMLAAERGLKDVVEALKAR